MDIQKQGNGFNVLSVLNGITAIVQMFHTRRLLLKSLFSFAMNVDSLIASY